MVRKKLLRVISLRVVYDTIQYDRGDYSGALTEYIA